MLVRDQDHCVLGRRLGSAANRWSTLAGFVEAGESPEAAVWREVYEEVGLRVDALRYRGSQPWPFPSSLMLAYEAHAPYGDLTINEEHHEVKWFTRTEIAKNLASGALAVPSGLSAGGHLINAWISERRVT
jgi:NAD+ diphosphatase